MWIKEKIKDYFSNLNKIAVLLEAARRPLKQKENQV